MTYVYGETEDEFGKVLSGVWMRGPRQAMLMRKVMEKAMADYAGRPEETLLASWHREACSTIEAAKRKGWVGWSDDYPVEKSATPYQKDARS